jgi:capsular exopolysaccharide synthesis family protein
VRIGFSDLDSGWRAIMHDKWVILGSAVVVTLAAAITEVVIVSNVQFRTVAVFFGMSILCASSCAYFRSARRSDRLHSNALANHLPDAPVLGHVPSLPEKRIDSAPGGIIQEPRYVEAIRNVAATFTEDTSRANSIILVSSVRSGEGKTSVALNLAVALSRNARVMLVDADLRDAGLSRRVALPRYDAGLTELIERNAPYRSCLALTGIPNLHIIRTGSLPHNVLALLKNVRFENTLHLSRRYYDHIVIDSPALEAHTDASVLASHADAVMLVADARAGQFGRIREELNKLKQVNARCAGIVFNRVNSQQ